MTVPSAPADEADANEADLAGGGVTLLVLALWAAGLCAAAQFAKMSVILPELEAIYSGRGPWLGFLVTLISLLGAALGLVAGWLGASVGARRLLLGSVALGAAISAVQALVLPFPVMLALRLLEGLSHLGIVVAAPTLIGTLTPPSFRGAAMTLWGTFFGVAFAIVAWLGVPLVRQHGVGALFLAHAAAMVAVGLVLTVILPRVGRGTAPRFDLRAIVARHRSAYGSPRIAAPAWGWLFYTLTFVALVTVLPTLVAPAERGLVATAMPLASIVVSLTLGIGLLRVMPAVGVVAVGFVAAIVVALSFLLGAPSAWQPIALLGVLGLVQGASFAAVPQLNADAAEQALANGAMAQMGNAGNLLGTPLLLAALAWGGTPLMTALVVAAYALALLAHGMAARARPREVN